MPFLLLGLGLVALLAMSKRSVSTAPPPNYQPSPSQPTPTPTNPKVQANVPGYTAQTFGAQLTDDQRRWLKNASDALDTFTRWGAMGAPATSLAHALAYLGDYDDSMTLRASQVEALRQTIAKLLPAGDPRVCGLPFVSRALDPENPDRYPLCAITK